MTEITCIGLGLMGSALARAMLAAGHRVTVWNRTPGKAAALTAMGAAEAPSFSDAVSASPILMICIDNYASTHALLKPQGRAGLLAGRTLISMTTGTPREAEALCAWVQAQGGRYLDGAILPGPNEIVTSSGDILISGDQAVWQIAQPFLSCLAGRVRLVGDRVGAAAALDFAWLTMSMIQFVGVAHAANICRSQDIDLQAFMDIWPFDPAPVDPETHTPELARRIKEADYHHPTATLQVWGEALAHIQAQARDSGINAAVPDFIAGFFQKAVAMGLGQQEAIAIYKTLLATEQEGQAERWDGNMAPTG